MAFVFQGVGARVASLELHALKGGGRTTGPDGGEIDELVLAPAGPEHLGVDDRGLVIGSVIDAGARTASFVSRRGWEPGTERIRYPGDGVLALVRSRVVREGVVALGLPGVGEVSVDLRAVAGRGGEAWEVAIFGDPLWCLDAGDEAADLVSEILNTANTSSTNAGRRSPARRLRLFVRDRRSARLVRPEYRLTGHSHVVGGADGGAVLAANLSSLAALEGTSAQRDPRRVAANVWLDGLDAFVEDRIAAVAIGADGAELAATGPCARCVATNANPDSGRHDGPRENFLSMLASGRRGSSSVTGGSGAYFAINLAPADTATPRTIRTGDEVRVAWAESPTFVPLDRTIGPRQP